MVDPILFGFCPRLIPVQVQPESESESECDSECEKETCCFTLRE